MKHDEGGQRPDRRRHRAIPALLLAGLLGVEVQGIEAFAQTRAPRAARAVELAMPLRDGVFYLGDLRVRVGADGSVAVERARMLDLVRPILTPEAMTGLDAIAAQDEFTTLSELAGKGGLEVEYDQGVLELRLKATLEQRRFRSFSLLDPLRSPESEQPAPPARTSAYLNLRLGKDFVSKTDNGDDGWDDTIGDLDGALRLWWPVLEGEASFSDTDFDRRGNRLVLDFQEEVLRARFGDIVARPLSFQGSEDVLGLSLTRAYADLQPSRNIRPSGRRSLRLERPSSIEVYVNGRLNRRLRLEPGNYEVRDFVFSTGANDVRLIVEDDTGRREVIDFSLFLDRTLLAEGIDEFDLNAGIVSDIDGGEREYEQGDPVASGFYRRGVTETLTLGANAQADSNVAQVGAEALKATPFGTFGLDLASSHFDGEGFGWAANLDYDLLNAVSDAGIRHNVRFSAEMRSSQFGAVGDREPDNPFRWELAASYSRDLPWDVFGSLSSRYANGRARQDDEYGIDLTLNRSFGRNWSASTTFGISEGGRDDGVNLFVQLTYTFDTRNRTRASYDTRDNRSRLNHTRTGDGTVGTYNYDLEAERDVDGASLTGGATYFANRAELNVSHRASYADIDSDDEEQRTSFRLGTALAFADGKFVIGRPITNSFAIVSPHPNLGSRTVYVTPGKEGEEARSDWLMSALAPRLSPYGTRRLTIDVDDLPLGYDLGAGAFDLFPPYRSGYTLTVGSDYTVTVIGVLLDAQGEPVSLVSGRAIDLAAPEREPVSIFTNRAGRFGAQGLRPGQWRIETSGESPLVFELTVPEGHVGLLRAGQLRANGP